MTKPSADELVKKELKKRSPEFALGYFSRLFQSTGDPTLLEACAKLLAELKDPEEFNGAYWALTSQLFARGKEFPAKLVDRILFKHMARAHFLFLERLQAKLKLPPPVVRQGPIKRLAVISQQVLEPPHSPTMVALELAHILQAHAGVETLIVNTNAWPVKSASTFHPTYFVRFRKETGHHSIAYKGSDLRIFSAGGTSFTTDKLQTSIDALADFAPDAVFSLSSGNVVADLASRSFPTMSWPSTQQEPVSRAHLVFYRTAEFSGSAIDREGLDVVEPVFVREDFNLDTVPEKIEIVTRERLKVPDSAFLYVLVGTRLTQEMTPEYQAVLARIFAAVETAHVLIVGVKQMKLDPVLAPYKDRISVIVAAEDLRGVYDACDCFLNPPRQGGGNSAYIAMHENLPIVTLDDCDVQMTIGKDAACADFAAYEALAVALSEQGVIYEKYCERSRLRVAALHDPAQAAAKLLGHAESARARFCDVDLMPEAVR